MKLRSSSRTLGAAALLSSFAVAGLGGGCSPKPTGETSSASSVSPSASLRRRAELAGGFVTQTDQRGVPTFIRGANRIAPPPARAYSPEESARFHAERFAGALALRPEALSVAASVHVAERGEGGTVVQMRQKVGGVEVYDRELRMLMRPDRSLVALSGALHPTTTMTHNATFVRPPELALAGALSHAAGLHVDAAALSDANESEGDHQYFRLAPSDTLVMPEKALVRRVLFPQGEQLRPAYHIEFYAGRPDSTDSEAWRYVVAADDGSLLEKTSLTQKDAFNYRVWVDGPDKRPLDGPQADWTPHPASRPDLSSPPFIAPTIVSMEGFNKNPQGRADPWLAPTATSTAGNNADVYIDRRSPDGIGGNDFRATLTGPLTFDRTYDFTKEPIVSNDQAMAAITNAFYVVNWQHDYWYDSGFNEKAGVAQGNNFGRGGFANDIMKVETQDFSGRDNANMSTPSDGSSPRMQMYLWSGKDDRTLHVSPLDVDEPSGSASFGPDSFDLTGTLVEIDDGAFPSPTDGCEPIKNDVQGKIALIDRGTCTFKRKCVNAELAGAIGVLIVNNVNGDAPGMGNGDPMATVLHIPVLSTTKLAGSEIRAAMADGPVTVHYKRVRDIDRDAGLDSSVITHEWGHYLHHRLSKCGNTQQCGALSEGWADFVALMMTLREGDNLDGTYGLAIYACAQFLDPGYYGIRRQPYSVNFAKNGLTFKHIADGEELPLRQLRSDNGTENSEVHAAGEIWASMMFEVYVALQKAGPTRSPARSFEQTRRVMANYVVTGLEMVPNNATFTETRDAIIAAAAAGDPEDEKVVSEAFARRGAGTCADSPARTSETLVGVVEGFTVQPRLVIGDVLLEETMNCDADGVLDAGEKAKITISLSNGAQKPLQGAVVTLSSPTVEATFLGPVSFNIPDLAPFESTTIETEVTLDKKMPDPGTFTLRIVPSGAATCEGTRTDYTWKINYDVGEATASTDDVESTATTWSTTGINGEAVWQRIPSEGQNHVWHGGNYDIVSDTALESVDLKVSNKGFFLMRFEHRHSFNANTVIGTRTYYDGGLIELSEDGGTTWEDLSTWVTPGYNGILTNTTDNPLKDHRAFVDKNVLWPNRERVTMNFLDKLAGKTVRIRFRVVTDGSIGDQGWSLDNISFQGLDNTPFSGTIADKGLCGEGPRGPAARPMKTGCNVAQRSTNPAPLALLLALPLLLLAARLRRRRSN